MVNLLLINHKLRKKNQKVAPKPKQFKTASASSTPAVNDRTKMTHSPSLEEVEDEESILYNKKFGH